MKAFNSIPEPWAKVVAVLATCAVGVLFAFLIKPGFGVGVACGAVVCVLIHWTARIDERPFWQHVFGRKAVYGESQQDQAAKPGGPASRGGS